MNPRNFIVITALSATLALLGCNKQPEAPAPAPAPAPVPAATPPAAPVGVSVSSIDLGNAVGADERVTAVLTEFKTTDTIYASVTTTGSAASVNLAAKWTYQDGQTVNETSKAIAPTGPSVTAFQIAKPDGWPLGKYKVEITKDGVPAGVREFEVK